MSADKDSYLDLIERIDRRMFSEMDSDTVMDLRRNNEEYATMKGRVAALQEAHPFINDVMEGEESVSLSVEEHKVLIEYFDIYRQAENIERQQIYFRGHTDCFAYLKRIGVI